MTFTELEGNVRRGLCSNVCAQETSFLVVVCATQAYEMTHRHVFKALVALSCVSTHVN